jgi:molecular chaperone DnaK
MARATIDFGIDLGTTNSSIAELRGTEVHVFKNNDNSESTSSAIWFDRQGRQVLGRMARQRFYEDEDNACIEFKLEMGKPFEKRFARCGRSLKPEEMSAEILKSLRGDVQQKTGEEIQAAVITVPAKFGLPACNATSEAARLAGFSFHALLQEPVAAALAYGFQCDDEKVYWLVYDFGGGTFDAALIHMRDGGFRVANHGGDDDLGGKLIDWAIVEQLLAPAVSRQCRLKDFRRGNPKWIQAFAKLKGAAEEAKIRCSREQAVPIFIEHLCTDDTGQPVEFEFELQRADVERLAEPFVLRTLNICKQVLTEHGLKPDHLQKVLLVGGPTLMPYLRERLEDAKNGLGRRLEFQKDPLTVVAQGAAIFAGTQRCPSTAHIPAPGNFAVELEYQPIGSDPEPLVGGKIVAQTAVTFKGYTIEFVNSAGRTPWRSGKLVLGPEGTFMTQLWAEKGCANIFEIVLCNAAGTRQSTEPDHFTYTIGRPPGEAVLINTLGVELASGEMRPYVRKGTPLPAKGRCVHRTVLDLRRGQTGELVRIPFQEGERLRRPDRNRDIGELHIKADDIHRDLPAGSEIEVTIDIDASRCVRASAFIPLLDKDVEAVFDLQERTPDLKMIRDDFAKQRQRLDEIRGKVETFNDPAAREKLRQIDDEQTVRDVEMSLAAAQTDQGAAGSGHRRLLDLKMKLDDIEDLLEWPSLAAKADRDIADARDTIQNPEFGATSEEKARLNALEREVRQARDRLDVDEMQRKLDELAGLGTSVVTRHPGFWVGMLTHLEEKKHLMRDAGQADAYFSQGRRAMHNGDVEALKAAARQLLGLLPIGDPDRARSGII